PAATPGPKVAAPGKRKPAACRHDTGCVGCVDPAVDADRRIAAVPIEQFADSPYLRLAARDKSLTAKAGVYRHHQHVIDVRRNLIERDDGCGGGDGPAVSPHPRPHL